MKINIYRIFNMEKFAKLVKEGCGHILWQLPDDTMRDLKSDSRALRFIEKESAKGHGIEIYLSDKADYNRFVDFMMDGCL